MKMVALEFDLKQLSLWKLPKQRSEKINFLFPSKVVIVGSWKCWYHKNSNLVQVLEKVEKQTQM